MKKSLLILSPLLFSFFSYAQIDSNSFAAKVDFSSGVGTASTQGIAIADFNDDGRNDIATVNGSNNTFSVFRNKSTSGMINTSSFDTQQIFAAGNYPANIAAGDIDMDGKPDLVVPNWNSSTISFFKNISASGVINFSAKKDFAVLANPGLIKIADLNGDGKMEIVFGDYGTNSVSVFKNMSTSGTLSLSPRQDFSPSGGIANTPREVEIGDIDLDGKPDIVVLYNNGYIGIFKNTTTTSTLTFAASVNLTGINKNAGLSLGDIDGDGKLDIAVSSYNSGVELLFRNTSSGSITFSPYVSLAVGSNPLGNALADMDHDGRPDLMICNTTSNTISVFRNIATSGSITPSSFGPRVNFVTGAVPLYVGIADLDGDGKPEMICSNNISNTVSVLKNKIASHYTGIGAIENVINDILIYPNPANTYIQIKDAGHTGLEIVNILGKQMYCGSDSRIDLSTWPKGVYFIKTPSVVKKFILE